MTKGRNDEEEEKPRFRIVDRRGETDDVAEAPVKPTVETPVDHGVADAGDEYEYDDENITEGAAKTEMTEEERQALHKEVEKSLQFKNTVIFILRTLSDQVWIHMGLIPNPITHLTVKNMEEARKLIDLFEVVAVNTKDEFDPATYNEILRLLSDLKINYTNQI